MEFYLEWNFTMLKNPKLIVGVLFPLVMKFFLMSLKNFYCIYLTMRLFDGDIYTKFYIQRISYLLGYL